MNVPSSRGVTLVIGPANSGKMGHALEWWGERLRLRPVLVAPTGPDARELSMEMVRRTGGLLGQSEALTFDGLVRCVLGWSPRYATDLERRLIVSRLLRSIRVEALGNAVHLPGVTTALAALLEQLGESGKRPDEIDRILARWGAAEPGLGALAGDIRRLTAAYGRTLADVGLDDRPAAVREAVQAAEDWTRPVSFYGFTSFTQGQRALIEALSRQAEVLVSLPHERLRELNLSTPAEVSWWEARAAQVVELTPRARAYSSPAVAYLERHFMSDAPRPEPPRASTGVEGVRFLRASGRRGEAELAAGQVSDLIRAGFRPRDIAVVVRQVRAWSAVLADVLDSCGIPYQVEERRVLAETGLGHALLRAVRGAALDDPYGILAYLRSPYSGVSLEQVSDLELRYRRGTARGVGVLAGLAGGMGLDALEPLQRLVQSGPRGPRLDLSATEALSRRMLSAALRSSVVGSREIEADARAFRAAQAAFRAMAGLARGDDRSEWLEPRMALASLAQVSVPGTVSGGCDAVQILSVHRARARRFDVVLVLGLVEGEFPRRQDTPSLLSPAQQARLDSLGEGLFAPEADQEGALFASAISRAWQLLVLSARDAEDDGGEAVPSQFWQSAKSLLGLGEHDHEASGLADQVFSPGTAPSLRHYLRACAARGYTPHDSVVRAIPDPAAYAGRPFFRLTDSAVLGELEAMECFSPSALEAYIGCPFAWFVGQVIRNQDVDFELDGRVSGQLLHSALGATYRELASAGMLPLTRKGIAVAEGMADAAIDRFVTSEECPGSAAERRLVAWELKKMARNLFAMESSAGGALVFREAEKWVGGRQGVDIGGLRVRGRLDRLDSAPGESGLFVIDYKSRAIPSAAAIGSEKALQLPLYLMALAAEHPAEDIIGGAYVSLWETKRAGVIAAGSEALLGSATEGFRVLDGEAQAEMYRTAREIAGEAARGMNSGTIAPRADRQCPCWCRLGPACRARQGGYRP